MPSRNLFSNKKSNFYKKLNIVLVILIVICGIVVVYLYVFLEKPPQNDNQPDIYKDHYNTNLKINSIMPLREAGIINGHEHILNLAQADKWLEAMAKVGVSTTVMLGSPDATFHRPTGRFDRYKENNEEIFEIVNKYPEHFIAFPTIYTYDDNKLELLKSYINRGALGLKLFTGHLGSFWDAIGPLNHSSMYPVYEYCEKEHVPLIWHVHLGDETIKAEFEDVLKDFPNLIINVPHFMLSSIITSRLEHFLNTYPNLYTDISFGEFAHPGFWRLSNHSNGHHRILTEYQDRFTFGTDMVVTDHSRKDVEWITSVTQGYKDVLEKKYYNLTVKHDIEGDFNGDNPGTHNGLYLEKEVLDKIYYDNMIKFLNCRFYYENLSDVINKSNLTFEHQITNETNSQQDKSRCIDSESRKISLAVSDKIYFQVLVFNSYSYLSN